MPWVEKYQQRVIKRADREAYESRDHWDDFLEDLWISALCRLLIGIQRYGHGGTVLISNEDKGLTPKYSIKYPRLSESLVRLGVLTIAKTFYSDQIFEKYLDPQYDELPVDLYLDEGVSTDQCADTTDELKGCIRFITSLSRVDGLLWLDSNLSLQAFGVEIAINVDPPKVFKAGDTGAHRKSKLDLSHLRMRHRSMIRYCASNPKAVGFVVSQDGDVRAITRVDDSVVLWDNVRIQSVLMPSRVPRISHRE